MPKMLVGIDVSLRSHHIQFMDDSGTALTHFALNNDQPGANKLVQSILTYVEKNQYDSVLIGMEATSNLGWHLAHFLNQELKEQDFPAQVYVLNAKTVADFKKNYGKLVKNDRVDAWVIADHLRFGRLPYAMQNSAQFEAIQRLTRTRFHLIQSISRDKTYFLNLIFLKFSSIRLDNPFASTFGSTSLALIQELEPDQILAMPVEELIHFLQDKGKNHFADPQAIAQTLKKLARSSYRLDKTLAEPVNIAMASVLSVIHHMEAEVKKLDKEIEKLMKNIPQTLSSIKGVGPVYAAGILAEIGDIHRFKDHNALAKYAGLVWNQHQSGEYESQETKRMFTGDKYLRYYLVQAADHVRRYDSEYKAFYQAKYNQVTKHQHKRALVLTARKLVRLVFTLLKTNQLYTPPERR